MSNIILYLQQNKRHVYRKLFTSSVLVLLSAFLAFPSLAQSPTVSITGSNIGNCMPDTLTVSYSNTTPYIIGWGIAGSLIYQQRDTAKWNIHATTVAGNPMNAPQPAPTTPTAFNLLFNPRSVFVDNQQRVFVAERGSAGFGLANHRVVRWDPPYTSGVRVAGSTGTPTPLTYAANSGPAIDSNLFTATGVWVDANYIYVLENARVLRYPNNAGTTSGPAPFGTVVAGNGANGSTPVANPLGSNLTDIFFDVAGNMYVVDASNHCVQKFDVTGGFGSGTFNPQGTVVAGTYGSSGSALTQLATPSGMYIDGGTNFIYVSDYSNQRIMKFPTNPIGAGTVVAGVTGSFGSGSTKLNGPLDVWADCNGYVYVADGQGSNSRIQRFNPNSVSGDAAVTIAGFGPNIVGSTTLNSDSQLHQPSCIFMNETHVNGVANNGVFYVVDQGNCHRIQRYNLNAINTKFVPTGVVTKKSYTATILNSFSCNATGLISNKDTVYAVPSGITATATNPSTCGGSNGKITITGVSNGNTYNFSYTVNGVTRDSMNVIAGSITANALVINNLSAGTYSNIVVYIDPNKNCTSTPLSLSLSDPPLPNAPTLAINSIVACSGNPITLTVTAPTGAGYTYQYSGPGITGTQTASTAAIQTTANATLAYSGVDTIRAVLNNCVSAPTTANIQVNFSPVISATTVQPTICSGGCNGSITIAGLQSGTTYTVSSSSTGTTLPTIASTGGGTTVTFSNLCSGAYTNIKLTPQGSTCVSNTLALVTLQQPTAPTFTLSQTGPTSCGGVNGTITINGLTISTSGYSYTLNGVTTSNITTNASGQIIINNNALPAGTYTITVTYGGCVSTSQQIVLSDPNPPTFTLSRTNPTTCGGTQGTITISGLTPSTSGYSYILNNGTPVTGQTSTNTGTITISGLSAGSYNIKVSLGGCLSAQQSITLTGPTAPTVTANLPVTICSGRTLNLNASSTAASGSVYTWTGPNGNIAFTGPNATQSNVQSPSLTGALTTWSGIYTVTVTDAITNCVSNNATTNVVVTASPVTPSPTSNSPICVGDTLKILSNSTTTYHVWSGPCVVAANPPNSVTSTNLTIPGASASCSGTYTLIDSANGCASLPGTVNVIVNTVPSLIVVSSTDPTTCTTPCTGKIKISGLTPGNYTISSSPQITPNTFTVAAGNNFYEYTNICAGIYSNIKVAPAGTNCYSNVVAQVTLTNPTGPTFGLAGTNPTQCGASDGIITINGLTPGNTYVATIDGVVLPAATAVGTTLTFGGSVGGYASGIHTVFLALNGCQDTAHHVTLTAPSNPTFTTSIKNNTVCSVPGNGAIRLLNLVPNSTTYSYSLDGGANYTAFTSSAAGTDTIKNLSGGTYNVVIKIGTCISAPQVVTLTNPSLPTISAVGLSSNGAVVTSPSICAGETLKLFGSTNVTPGTAAVFTWTAPVTSNAFILNPTEAGKRTPVLPNALTSWSGTYSVFVTDTNSHCVSVTAPITVTVKPLPPTPVATSNSPVCVGNTINLFANSTTPFHKWTGPCIGIASTPNTAANQVIPNSTFSCGGMYILTDSANGCRSIPDTILVVMNITPAPVVGTVTPSTSCVNFDGSIQFNNLTPNDTFSVIFSGTSSGTLTAVSNASGSYTISNLNQGTYNFTFSKGSCTSPVIGPIVVLGPSAPPVVATTPNASICAGDTLKLFANGTFNINDVFSWTNGGGTYTSTAQNPVRLNTTSSMTDTYTVLVSDVTTGCTSTSSVSVVVNNIPAAPFAPQTIGGPFCSGAGVLTLKSTAIASYYQWRRCVNSNLNTCVILPDTTQIITRTPPQTTDAGLYYVRVRANGCYSAWSVLTNVTIPATPVITASAINPTSCITPNGKITVQNVFGLAPFGNNFTTIKQGTNFLVNGIFTYNNGSRTFQGLGPGTDTVYVTNAGICRSNKVVVTLTNPAPPVGTASVSPAALCENFPLTFTATSNIPATKYSWVGPSVNTPGFPINLQNPTIDSAVVAHSGVYTVTLTDSNTNCTSTANSNVLTVWPAAAPLSASVGIQPSCTGSPIQLLVNAPNLTTYGWTGPGITSNIANSANPVIPSATFADSGTYCVHGATGFGCLSDTVCTHVEVRITPSITFVSQFNLTLCNTPTGMINIHTSVPDSTYTVLYTFNNQSVVRTITASSTGNILIDSLLAGTVSNISVSLNGCSSSNNIPGPFILTNPAPPTFALTYVNPITCNGANGVIFLSGVVPNTTYFVQYTGPGYDTAHITSNPSGILALPGLPAGSYTNLTITYNNCTSAPYPLVILQDPLPPVLTITTNANNAICEGGTLFFGASTPNAGNVSYFWTGPNGFTSNAPIDSIVNASPLASGVYSVTAVNNTTFCSTGSGVYTVHDTVYPKPSTPVISSNSPACTGSMIQFLSQPPTPANSVFHWYGQQAFAAVGPNPTKGNIALNDSGWYYAYTIANGCVSDTDSTYVEVHVTPTVGSTSFTNPTTCGGFDGTITINGVLPNTFYYFHYNNGSTPINDSQVSSPTGTIFIDSLFAGTYSNFGVTLLGCISNTLGPVTLVDPIPPSFAVSSTNPTTCGGSEGSMTISGLVPGKLYTVNYNYLNPLGIVPMTATLNASAAGTITFSNLSAGSYGGVITVTDVLTHCYTTHVTTVTLVDPLPPVLTGLSITPDSLCEGGTVTLTAIPNIPNAVYTWYGPSGQLSPVSQTLVFNNVLLSQAGTYTVTATVNNCVSSQRISSFVVKPNPVTPFLNYNAPVCSGDTLKLYASNVQGATYTWTGPAIQTVSLSHVQNPVIPNSVVPFSGWYTVLDSVNGCASQKDSIFVVVNQTPVPPVVTNNNPVCVGGCINIATPAPGNYTWYDNNHNYLSSNQSVTICNATQSNGGIYYLLYIAPNGCKADTSRDTVVVNPIPPTPIINANSPICLNGSIIMSVTTVPGVVTYQWYGPGITTANEHNATQNLPATLANQGTYSVYVTVNGCTSVLPGTINIVVTPLPPAPNLVTTNSPVCSNATLTLSATVTSDTSIHTFKWTAPGGLTNVFSPNNSNQTPTVTPPIAGVYSVYAIKNGCQSATAATTNVIVKPTPTPVISVTPNPACEGDIIHLQATAIAGTVNPNWTGPNNYVSALLNTYLTNVTVAQSGSYTYYITLNGCTGSTTTNLVINPKPAALAPGVDSICQFSSTAITVPGNVGTEYWYTGPVGGTPLNPTGTPFTPPSTIAVTTTYYVAQRVGACESDRVPRQVTVVPQPVAPTPTTTHQYFCLNTTASPLTVVGNLTNVHWYNTTLGGTPYPNPFTPPTSALGTTVYYVATVGTFGCESPRVSDTVSIVPTAPMPVVPDTIYFCQGDPSRPLATFISANNNNIKWYTVPVGGQGFITSPVPNTNIPGTTIWYITNTQGCESERKKVVVLILAKPSGVTISSSRPFACQFDTLKFTYNGPAYPNMGYLWTVPNGDVILSGNNTTGPLIVRFDSAVGTTQFVTFTIDNRGCRSITDSIQLEIRQAPLALMSVKHDICVDELVTVQLTYESIGIQSFNWFFNGATVVDNAEYADGPYGIKWSQSGVRPISVTLTQNQCVRTIIDSVVIHDAPVAHINTLTNINNICAGDTVSFKASVDSSSYIYEWLPRKFFPLYNDSVAIKGVATYTTHITLNVVDPFGCTGSDSVYVTTHPCCDIYVPDAFTPNGDGHNDVFRILGDGHTDVSIFRIQNRWGQTVYETHNKAEGWNGTFNGTPQEMGVYNYFIRYRCLTGREYDIKGEVTLIR